MISKLNTGLNCQPLTTPDKRIKFGDDEFGTNVRQVISDQNLSSAESEHINNLLELRNSLNEEHPKFGFLKTPIEILSTALIFGAMFVVSKGAFHTTKTGIKEAEKLAANIADQAIKSQELKKAGEVAVNTGKQVTEGLNKLAPVIKETANKNESSKAFVNKFEEFVVKFSEIYSEQKKKFDNSKLIDTLKEKKVPEKLLEAIEFGISACVAIYSGLVALEKIIDPMADKVWPDHIQDNTSDQATAKKPDDIEGYA